jgi:hypothetical protein
MTPENKTKLLAAFDALCGVSAGRPAIPTAHHSGKGGGSAQCDYCGKSLSDGDHDNGVWPCPIGRAVNAIVVGGILPDALDREAWVADPAKPTAFVWPTTYVEPDPFAAPPPTAGPSQGQK